MPKNTPESPGAAMARIRWAKTSEAERSAYGKMMAEARITKLGQKRGVGPPRKRKGKK